MRQDQERLLVETFDHIVGDLFGRQIAVAGLRAFRDRTQHVGIDALRAQDRDLDIICTMRDREVLGKADGGVFGRRIRRTANLREKPRRRDRVEEVTAAARFIQRHQMTRGIDVGHHMNRPAFFPRLVRRSAGIDGHRIETTADAGIRTKQVDRPDAFFSDVDEAPDVRLAADIAGESRAIDRRRNGFRAHAVHIGDDDLGRTGLVKGFTHRLPDAVAAACDDDDFAVELHVSPEDCYVVMYSKRDRAPLCNGTPRRAAQSHARSRSGNAAAAKRGRRRRANIARRPLR